MEGSTSPLEPSFEGGRLHEQVDRTIIASLDGLPPSSKLVYMVLWWEGPLTRTEIERETQLPRRTTHDAIKRLWEHRLIATKPYYHNKQLPFYVAKVD